MLLHLSALAASAALMIATPHPAGDLPIISIETWDQLDTEEHLPECFFATRSGGFFRRNIPIRRGCTEARASVQLAQYYGDYAHPLPPCYWGDLHCYQSSNPVYGPQPKNYYQRPFKGYAAGWPQRWSPAWRNTPRNFRPQYEGGGINAKEWRYYRDNPAGYPEQWTPSWPSEPRYGIRPESLQPQYEWGYTR